MVVLLKLEGEGEGVCAAMLKKTKSVVKEEMWKP